MMKYIAGGFFIFFFTGSALYSFPSLAGEPSGTDCSRQSHRRDTSDRVTGGCTAASETAKRILRKAEYRTG